MYKRQLETNVFQASSIAQKYNCNLRRLDFQQEQGLMSCLPLAQNLIEIQRSMTTSSTAIFVPFTTQELFQTGKEALYYGLNALSNNLIMVDRKKLKNPNGLILGTPGSGKSFSAKREIANAFLVTDDDVIVCDPEAEYTALVKKFEGQVIKISPSSTQYINPMDINANYSEEDNPIALKADFILSLCELIVGGKEGLQPVEKTVIDRCVHQIYQTYFEHPVPENMPVLQDLYEALLRQDEKEAHHVATALEIYVTGSLNLFNHRTNVDINNRLVCYDIKELGKQLKKIGMLVVQDQVWGRVTANRNAGKATRYYICLLYTSHEPLIDRMSFDIVQNKMKSRQRPGQTDEISLFAGLLKCGECGKSLTVRYTNAKHPQRIYSCKTYNAFGKNHCTQHRIDYDTLYSHVLRKIRECARAVSYTHLRISET